MSPETNHHCTLIDRFSFKEKLLMRTGWYGFMAVGFYGIYRQDPLWALLYAAASLLGFAVIVLPCLCAHCPYPSEYDTCLFLPPALLRLFYPYRGPRMSLAGKAATLAALGGMVIMPLFWLINNILLLLVFLLIGLPVLATFPLRYCRRCRHESCPMNKARGLIR
jgi:hypothetical protein